MHTNDIIIIYFFQIKWLKGRLESINLDLFVGFVWLIFSSLLQCHFARRGQVCPHGHRPHDHGEGSQGQEGHCAGLRPQSGNPRYGEDVGCIFALWLVVAHDWSTLITNPINSMLSVDCITSEHRSLMETAYAYGSKYQFILITGGPVLKYLGWVFYLLISIWFKLNKFRSNTHCFSLCLYFSVELSHSSRVWFLHCRVHSGSTTPVTSERCPLTSMPKPLSTLNLHSFLQLMEAPLVVSRMEIQIHL